MSFFPGSILQCLDGVGVLPASSRQSSEMLLQCTGQLLPPPAPPTLPTKNYLVHNMDSAAGEKFCSSLFVAIDYSSQFIILELNILKSSLYKSNEKSNLYFNGKG